jgi:3-oxoacyl-[acyl-carrier protein] reductase
MPAEDRRAVVLAAGQPAIAEAVAERVLGSGRPLVIAGGDGRWAGELAARRPGMVACLPGDVADLATGQAAAALATERFGGPYALVNVLPLRPRAAVGEQDAGAAAGLLARDVRSLYCLSRPVAAALAGHDGGRIVTVTAGGWLGDAEGAAQSSASAAVAGFTRALALELGRYATTVNAVSTAYVDTPEWRDHRAGEAERADRATALRRAGRPADVAGAVAFLLGADAAFVTGQVLSVCGGATIGKSTY